MSLNAPAGLTNLIENHGKKTMRKRKNMQQITTVSTFVPAANEDGMQSQLRRIAERDVDLSGMARNGWALAHTATIPGPEGAMFVDTLTRTES
ncbi:hypothetical protein [Rathayibacter sp. AY1G1]|uniref:hypothetical protein n=1 Tax=Rathayibacter sp. AY1G1 TaxID=2080564 RepID=UPI0011B0D08A|nr:hypothetical protein [Rathayibacter sp. AY1G1]